MQQAERSVGLASPNPAVGCVLVHDEQVVGEGFHEYDRRDHAEIVALHQAGSLAHGSTAYVTLEPCSHHGRTGPCADALIAAGVARVVTATLDPNPIVRGNGVARLRAAGITVHNGVCEQAARQINDSFARFITASLPFVTMKVAASLDGRIAPAQSAPGVIHWITGAEARAEVHRMRHASDALVTGVGTILADDPLLTDRSRLPRRRPLLRIVLDSHLRTPLDSQLVKSAQDDVLLFFSEAPPEKQRAFEARGIHLQQISKTIGTSHLPLRAILSELARMQITCVLLEGGSALHTSALNEELCDKLTVFYAPRFLGQEAIPMLGALQMPPGLKRYELKRYGEDFALHAYLRDPWTSMQTSVASE